MRRLPILAALLLAAGPASAQEKFDLAPRAKAGDAYNATSQRVETLDFEPAGHLAGTLTRSLDQIVTILEVDGGRPARFEERTTRHEDRMKTTFEGRHLDESTSDLKGVAIRYDLVNKSYESMLLEGDVNPEVAERLRDADVYPLNENFLPTRPLAVGESETLLDQKRLCWALKETKSPIRYEQEPTLTLEKVAAVDGVRTAYLKLAFRGRATVAAKPGLEPESFHGKALILFDLDRGYVTRVETRAGVRAEGVINGTKGFTTADVVTANQFRKK